MRRPADRVCRVAAPGRAETRLERIILGRSEAIEALRREITCLALSPIHSLLVEGETGVGKDLVSRALLAASTSLHGELEVFNCPAIPVDHLESELFGTTRGAYPGAVDRPGAVERADGGLLMLDEIGAMPLAHQGKLLRLLESGEGRRLGARQAYRVKVGFVAATNEDLRCAIGEGRFRQDLFYRLVQDAVLRVPPLRERLEDVELLADRFLAELPPPPALSRAARDRLCEHHWPGNVRELRAVLRSASRLARGGHVAAAEIEAALARISGPSALDPGRQAVASAGNSLAGDFHDVTQALRRRLLIEALQAAQGNRTEAGVLLGLHLRRGERRQHDAVDRPDLAARKLAHRKFDYWWHRLAAAGEGITNG